MPKNAKPFKGIGGGVVEIAPRYASDAYRVVVALQIGSRIYVLHAFQKKSKKGIGTPKSDVDLIKKRYTEARFVSCFALPMMMFFHFVPPLSGIRTFIIELTFVFIYFSAIFRVIFVDLII